MPFGNPIVSGTTLVRSAIRSPDYVAGVSGWSINRDGSAEFNDVEVRGELLVSDPDGSYVRVYDQNPGNGAVIEMNPADVPGHTMDKAYILTDSATTNAAISIEGPSIDSAPTSSISLGSVLTPTPRGWLQLVSDEISADAALFRVKNNGTDPDSFRVEYLSGSPTTIQVDEKTLGFQECTVNQTPPAAATTTSATYVNITGATTGTFVKEHDATDVAIFMGLAPFSTAGGTVARFGLNFSGGVGDVTVGQVLLSSPSIENAGAAVTKVTGMPAGTYTVTPRWLRVAGAGTLTLTTSSGTTSFCVREVIEP